MKSVLFLDFDGVLNSCDYFLRERVAGRLPASDMEAHKGRMIDPSATARLNRVIEATGCDVVISSTWRRSNTLGSLLRLLVKRGLDRAHWDSFVGMTPVLDGRLPSGLYTAPVRGDEVQAWLDAHPGYEAVAILDDDGDMAGLRHRLVLTNGNDGLTDEKAEEVVKMLKTPL